jgi:hypothetical protein
MKNWFSRLMAFLAGGQTHTSRCRDWRGHPLGEGEAGTIPSVRLAKIDPYTTLRLPSFPEAHTADPERDFPTDPM